MAHLPASKARQGFADTINRAAYGKERVVVRRRGKEIAAVVPIDDLRLLKNGKIRLISPMLGQHSLKRKGKVQTAQCDSEGSWLLCFHYSVLLASPAERQLKALAKRLRNESSRASNPCNTTLVLTASKTRRRGQSIRIRES